MCIRDRFCAYALMSEGFHPIVAERGKKVEERTADVQKFWETGVLDTASNVQFGEGGAGTFSDGKLNTLVKDPIGRNRFVLETFVKFGAPEHILYENKPHIGTDILADVIKRMRESVSYTHLQFHFTDNFYLPVYLVRQTCVGYKNEQKTYTEKEAKRLASENLKKYLDDLEEKGIQITEKNVIIEMCIRDRNLHGMIQLRLPQ